MSSSSVAALMRGFALLSLAATTTLVACAPEKPRVSDLQREDAERQALIEAMKHHPALTEGGDPAATGKPINVSTAIPPKTPESDDRHDHRAPEPQR